MSAVLHASAVEFGGHGVLITGASGSGKSTLAWSLIGLGGTLVADDSVFLKVRDGNLEITAPEHIAGKIEARGVGLFTLPWRSATARLIVDLDQREAARLPPPHTRELLGITLPLLRRIESPAFPVMLRAYVQGRMSDATI